ncbi:MAG: hypothetical protein FH756_00255 [Firmicutes bacterium]|nr:hypothetical protein [Bacillota bacterium]
MNFRRLNKSLDCKCVTEEKLIISCESNIKAILLVIKMSLYKLIDKALEYELVVIPQTFYKFEYVTVLDTNLRIPIRSKTYKCVIELQNTIDYITVDARLWNKSGMYIVKPEQLEGFLKCIFAWGYDTHKLKPEMSNDVNFIFLNYDGNPITCDLSQMEIFSFIDIYFAQDINCYVISCLTVRGDTTNK